MCGQHVSCLLLCHMPLAQLKFAPVGDCMFAESRHRAGELTEVWVPDAAHGRGGTGWRGAAIPLVATAFRRPGALVGQRDLAKVREMVPSAIGAPWAIDAWIIDDTDFSQAICRKTGRRIAPVGARRVYQGDQLQNQATDRA